MNVSYAENPIKSKGRVFQEKSSDFRSEFQRDRDRIIHCGAFRRLQHKTQVFLEHEGDFFRTRLTHTIEVSQVARSISHILGLNVDLTEAIALAHDLGHPPFGHTGEEALNDSMQNYGGFDHNAQTLKIVTILEDKYASFKGLNLTLETLEGIAKHNGFIQEKPQNGIEHIYKQIKEIDFGLYSSAEAQVASIADDIAYNNHDLADGLRAGLFSINDLQHIPIISKSIDEIDGLYVSLSDVKRRHEILRKIFNRMVMDVAVESQLRLEKFKGCTVEDIRNSDSFVISFSPQFSLEVGAIREVLFKKMYRHEKVRYMRKKCTHIVKELFSSFLSKPNLLPVDWSIEVEGHKSRNLARKVCDYLAGMTDRYAIQEHERLFNKKI